MLAYLYDAWQLPHAGWVMAREGLLRFIPDDMLSGLARLGVNAARLIERRTDRRSRAERLSAALIRLGPSWVKLGQFLSTRPDIVGPGLSRDLEQLQDRLPPFSQDQAEKMIERALGRPVAEVFAWLGPPVAAASIAQVHHAQLRRNSIVEEVAVKVLRPGIRDRFARDLHSFMTAARLMEAFFPSLRRLKPVGIVKTLQASVAVEMDMRLEGAALSEMAENIRRDEDFIVPGVQWDVTARDVLVTEWVDGIPLHDIAALQAAGLDLKKLARKVMQNFLRHALRDGFFHADMHQGNLFADRQGRIIAVDFGIMGRLGPRERRFLAEILWSFINRDYLRGARVHFEAGYVPAHHSVELFAQALRAVGEPIHQKTADQISMARVLAQLFEYTELFDMHTRLELVMLQKTMVVTEGVARSLDPGLDMWQTAEPVVAEWMRDNFGPIGQARLARETGRELLRFIADLPENLRSLQNLGRDLSQGVKLSPESLAALAEENRRQRKWQTLALWLIAVLLATALFFNYFG